MNHTNCSNNKLTKLSVSDITSPLPNLKNTIKTDTIANWLISWLESNNIEGALLPTKAEFAYALGVSLGTIQNVFKILENKNYIFLKQKVGAIITNKNNTDYRKQTSKSDIAVGVIKDYITNSNLEVGEKFISSRQISSMTKIPLNTVRVAINKLVSEGILKSEENGIVLANKSYKTNKSHNTETLVEKVKKDLKKYVSENYKIGEKLPTNVILAKKLNVSVKTVHNAIKLLEKENMLLCRRGTYGTIVTNTSMNSAFEPKREMSIFAPAQETAFYHYQKTQNKIKRLISENYNIGSKLPSIKEFSEQMDLSHNTIRKALNSLAKEGILRFSRGRYGGTFVIDMPDIEEQTFRWLAVNPKYAESIN